MYITTVVIEEIMSSMRNGVGDGRSRREEKEQWK